MVRTFACTVAAAWLAAFSAPAHGQLKIGYIDAEMITSNYERFQDAQKEAAQFEQELTREFNKQQNELQRLKENFERQSLLMSEQRKKEEQQSIQRKQQELQKFLEEVSGQQGKLQRRTQELLQPIIQRVNEAIATVAQEQDYDFVLNTGAIAFADEAHDLTEQVLEQLKRRDEEEMQSAGPVGSGR